jgi:PTS system galactitol-specific IIA component
LELECRRKSASGIAKADLRPHSSKFSHLLNMGDMWRSREHGHAEEDMSKPIISENLIVVGSESDTPNAESAITILCERLVEEGYVDSSYCQAVLDRERQFPTGLPSLPYATAIPHADANGVKRTGIAVAILHYPVPFRAMDSPEKHLDVRVILLLAVAEPSKQVSMLQWVCNLVQDQDVVKTLASVKSPREAMIILEPFVNGRA